MERRRLVAVEHSRLAAVADKNLAVAADSRLVIVADNCLAGSHSEAVGMRSEAVVYNYPAVLAVVEHTAQF